MKLVICEKPSQAQAYAAVLNAKKRQDGFLEGNDWLVSWCFGHLVELMPPEAYDEKYKRWNRDTLPILPKCWQYAASKSKEKQLAVLRGLMNREDVDSIVCATDAGREGQLIFHLVYDYCKCKKPIQRLWISSMEDEAIHAGFAKLQSNAQYDNLYRAALCRSQADWLVGINATRLFSCLYGATLAVGRVQSPTLAMIVRREEVICGFTPESFYTPEINCITFTASGEKQADPQAAEVVRVACDEHDAVCLSVEKKNKTIVAPKLYDLTTLQRDANRLLGFTAQQTLDYAQALYEKKLATYPRTDSRFLTTDMRTTAGSIVNWLQTHLPFAQSGVSTLDMAQVIDDSKVNDHHAIIPTMEITKADLTALPSGERDILLLICAHLLCATAPVHSYEMVTVVLECEGYHFTAKGKTVLRDGWKAIDSAFRSTLKNKTDDEDNEDASTLPELKNGQVFSAVSASVKEGKTAPPRRYTEDTLLSAMETAGAEDMPADAERTGLGTPATRAGIIEKLVKMGFVERKKKLLVPTNKGMNLIAVLPDEIKSPLLTAEWEQKLGQVERGEITEANFMESIATLVQGLVAEHAAPMPEYASLFAEQPQGDVVGKCPRCGADVTESTKGFFCSSRACKFALWKDSRFWQAKAKTLDKKIATALLSEGRVFFSDLKSERTGKTYAAAVVLKDDGGRVNLRLDFEQTKINPAMKPV